MKKLKRCIALLMFVILMEVTGITVFAGEWKTASRGWWYQRDDGSYPVNGWQWIDGCCYYFDQDGYCMIGTITPDGYLVNESGAWTVDGVVQTKADPGTRKGVSDLFDICTLSGGYEGENVVPYLLMSISIYSSPEPGSDKVGNYTITVPRAGLEDTGELRRDSEKTFSLISNGGGHARIEVVDDTFGAVVIHYVESGFECDLRMYEAYGNP